MTAAVLALTLAAKPLVIMIHGAGGGGWEYVTWKPVFEKAGYRALANDLVPAPGGLEKTTFDDYIHQIVNSAGKSPTILIGASMGGALVLKAAEALHPKAIVLVCSTSPLLPDEKRRTAFPYPPLVKWKDGPYEDTVKAMPDSDEAMRKFAWPKWRDESGAVLNEISQGVTATRPTCPVLSVIPQADDTISPEKQQALAAWCKADIVRFQGMSHVGPLLSRNAHSVADTVVHWLGKKVR